MLGRKKSYNGKITECSERLEFIPLNTRWGVHKALAFLYSQRREIEHPEKHPGHLRSVLLSVEVCVCPVTTGRVEGAYQNSAPKAWYSNKTPWEEHSLVEVNWRANARVLQEGQDSSLHARVKETRQ